MTRLANRTQEIAQFLKMVEGRCEERIFLIEAPSGCGKTSLLMRFEAECPKEVKSAWVDLKAAQTGAPYVFSRIRKKLGASNFPRFNRAVQQFMSGGVEVSHNELQGQDNEINIILTSPDEQVRNLRLTTLREAFFQDLATLPHPVLLILDTFNAAPETLANWIAGEFLAEVADAPNLFAIVAGHRAPEPSGEWMRCHHRCRLDNILEIDAWCEYVEAVGFPFNRGQVDVLVRYLGGRPSEIVQSFESLVRGARA
jgi:ABC-type molybdenum transport system ATPase subunit/photorepair protein PhrA